MASDSSIAGSMRNLRTILAMHRRLEIKDSDFCTVENIETALSTLSEELESFGLASMTTNINELQSVELVKTTLVKLINVAWNLIHKHRGLMKTHDELNDRHHRIANDNTNLTNHVKRLKEDLEKRQHLLSEVQERERRLKVRAETLARDLKREKDETIKLRKQLQSKDSQHLHELRRIQQSGHKLREQLQKSIGTYTPRSRVSQNVQSEQEKKLVLYQQTIRRLEENNGLMLQEINDLRDELALQSSGMQLQVEASGIWDDVDSKIS